MKKLLAFVFLFCLALGAWFFYSEIYTAEAQKIDKISFEIIQGEKVGDLAERLEKENVVRNAWIFKKYIQYKKLDRNIRQGQFEVEAPITLVRVVESLDKPSFAERTITVLPGWDLGDIAEYFEKEGIASQEDFYALVGRPATNYKIVADEKPFLNFELEILKNKPNYVSYEGYLSSDTFRIYKNATLEEVVKKLMVHRDSQITDEMYNDIKKSGRTFFEVLTMASLLEREVRSKQDKAKVSDLFWRRYDMNWALQADSTVHYAVRKSGNVFTTKEDRNSLSAWNTYKYPGLPLGPICSPSLESIVAAIYPEKNDNWYFLTDHEGNVKYGKTLEEHNSNVNKYLR